MKAHESFPSGGVEGNLDFRREGRICLLTARNFVKHAFRCGIYEAEDVLQAIDDVDLVHLKPRKTSSLRKDIHKWLVWHDRAGVMSRVNIAFDTSRLTKDYDLFIAYIPLIQDLTHLPSVRGWKDHCATSICWIDELWAADVPALGPWLPALKQFDHVVVGYRGTADSLSRALNAPCHFIPMAVDALSYSPYPAPPERVIDIYNMGRRVEDIHRALRNYTAQERLFYLYDTLNASYTEVRDHQQHRRMNAEIMKRSNMFVVAPGKVDMPGESRNQSEIGLRYYEGATAGAVMIGQAPDCESFKDMFGWPRVVIEVKPDGSDVAEVLSSLADQPETMAEIGRRNAKEALLRHDWAYRWEAILNIAGLSGNPKLVARKQALKEIADSIIV